MCDQKELVHGFVQMMLRQVSLYIFYGNLASE